MLARDFIVKKSGWTGIGVQVKEDDGGTTFFFTPLIPSVILRATVGGLIAYVFLHGHWKEMEAEISGFIQNALELKAA